MDPNRETLGRAESAPDLHLRGLLDLARLGRSGSELPELLAPFARIAAETLGFESVTINVYRPDRDQYEVVAAHGTQAGVTQVGSACAAGVWAGKLDPRFLRRGTFFIPATGAQDGGVHRETAWEPGDILLVALDGTDGRRLGLISVDEPQSGRRPDDRLLDILGAVAAQAAQAIEGAHQLSRLQGALARHRAVIETSLDAVIAVDQRGRIIEFNPAAQLLFGYRGDQVIGRRLDELLVAPADREACLRGLERAFEQRDPARLRRRIEVTAACADGRRLQVELSLTFVEGGQDNQAIVYGVARDISERLRGQQQLAYLAYHDRLTGLPNRILVEEQLDLAVARARRMNRAVALLFVDLDDFKAVNDRLGHPVGDQFLAAVAARMRAVLRDTDVLARQGGDEFLVLLSDLDDDPEHVAEAVGAKLHVALRRPFNVAGTELWTGASVGVSLYPDDASDTEALLRHADAAMYKAKRAGGGRLAFHRETATLVARRASVSTQLRRAIDRGELELHYQPIWRLQPRAITGVEALLRWRHPDRGMLGPDAFIALAEHSAVGDDLADWIVNQACRDAVCWQASGLRPPMNVNVSLHQLLASDFGSRMLGALRAHELDPSSFMIELTESAWTVDPADALGALADLRVAGASVAIDDFGAGFSSLSRLHELDVDAIKLDRVLLTGIPDDTTAATVLRAIVDLARVCDAALVAEGVETDEQLAWLQAQRIELAQGFLFGHPLGAGEVTPLLARSLAADVIGA